MDLKNQMKTFHYLLKGASHSLVRRTSMDDLEVDVKAVSISDAEDQLMEFLTKQYMKADTFRLLKITQ